MLGLCESSSQVQLIWFADKHLHFVLSLSPEQLCLYDVMNNLILT